MKKWEMSRGLVAVAVTVALGSGCSIALKKPNLIPPPQHYADQVVTNSRAEGIEGKVGWGRLTVFYIPVVPIHIQGDGNQQVMELVRDALRQVGYTVYSTEPGSPTAGYVLDCRVEEFWFNNYTWLFPFVPTWGSVRLNVALRSANGQTVWSQPFSSSGFTANFFDGYSIAANEAMEEILNEMVVAFASEDFRNSLGQAGEPPVSSQVPATAPPPAAAAPAAPVPRHAAAPAPAPQLVDNRSKEERLQEILDLFHSGAISNHEYNRRREMILQGR